MLMRALTPLLDSCLSKACGCSFMQMVSCWGMRLSEIDSKLLRQTDTVLVLDKPYTEGVRAARLTPQRACPQTDSTD